jgi:hypothetical protein
MAMEERKGIQIQFVLMQDTDPTKVYESVSRIATEKGGIFNGIFSFTFQGNPPRDRHNLSIFAETPKIAGEIVSALAKELGLRQTEGYILQMFPGTQYVPREQSRTAA